MAALAHELGQGALGPPPFRAGVLRATTEVLTAMRLLGYQHELDGRPVPGDHLDSENEIVDRVLVRLKSSPSARDMVFDRDEAVEVIRHNYLDVEPWPFGPLTL